MAEYNTTIINVDVMPIPYVEEIMLGDPPEKKTRIRQLFHKDTLRVLANCVSVNSVGEIVVENIGNLGTLVFAARRGLEIKWELPPKK